MNKLHKMAVVGGLAVALATFFLGPCARAAVTAKTVGKSDTEAESGEPCVKVFRTIPTGTYTPGEPLNVVIRIESQCSEAFGSLGLIETLSPNWSFVRMEVITGEMPPIYPAEGRTESLDFGWINMPEFPVEFQYTIKSSVVSEEPLVISGEAIYYFAIGGVHYSETVVTSVEAGSGAEGEERREGEEEGEEEGEGEGGPEGGNEGEREREGESQRESEGEDQGGVSTGCCRTPEQSTKSGFDRNHAGIFAGDYLVMVLAALGITLGAAVK